ncbi:MULTISPECIES: LysE family translocator [Comamonas]|uniref:LysE family translocator n=1 Tax=Comamonas TaxID=283 RepID=UPI002112AAB4|nr:MULTISPECIES: LysE family translocator [Comamonas]UUC91531.1 LysE family translocator [Comamonas sp. C11]WEE75373.1 LysE family translocator [Comamonas testosteroni]
MSVDLFLAFCVYALAMSISPGPANFLVLASGARHGALCSLPLIIGIATGLGAMVLVSGLGLFELLGSNLIFLLLMKIIGLAYIAWLAWKIMTSPIDGAPSPDGKAQMVVSFRAGLALPLFNPKAWIMAFGAVTSYTSPDADGRQIALVAMTFLVINAPCMLVWAAFGDFMSRLLTNPRRDLAFKLTMGGLLLLSIVPIARSLLQETL